MIKMTSLEAIAAVYHVAKWVIFCCFTTVRILLIFCDCTKRIEFKNHEELLPSDGKYVEYRYIPGVTCIPCRIVRDVNK